jgi:hypothetical protein
VAQVPARTAAARTSEARLSDAASGSPVFSASGGIKASAVVVSSDVLSRSQGIAETASLLAPSSRRLARLSEFVLSAGPKGFVSVNAFIGQKASLVAIPPFVDAIMAAIEPGYLSRVPRPPAPRLPQPGGFLSAYNPVVLSRAAGIAQTYRLDVPGRGSAGIGEISSPLIVQPTMDVIMAAMEASYILGTRVPRAIPARPSPRDARPPRATTGAPTGSEAIGESGAILAQLRPTGGAVIAELSSIKSGGKPAGTDSLAETSGLRVGARPAGSAGIKVTATVTSPFQAPRASAGIRVTARVDVGGGIGAGGNRTIVLDRGASGIALGGPFG